MAYKKTTWVTGDVITADKLNNIEEGIESVSGSDSPNTKDIRDYIGTSMSQKGQNYITLRPDDFSELYADGKVLTPGSDDSIAVETTNSAWKIYKYELGRAFVLRADQVVKNDSAAGCVPIAFRYKGVDYAVDYNRAGQYYLADTVLVSYNTTNEAYAIEEFSFTETVRQEFSDSIICRDHAGEFDSLVVFGDSIFANTISNPDTGARTNNGNGITKQLADLMGVPLYKHAVNNATLSTKYTGEAQNVVKQIQDYIASPDGGTTPLFVVEGGTNDAYHYGVSNLGTYGSSDTTTIYGAIYYAINLLLSIEGVQPWQILVCTPIPKGIRALWDGTTSFSSAGWLANTDLELTTIGHAMYEIALNRQCSVINGYNAIFDELSSRYICQLMMGDDTHPTVYGSERYARYIYDTLFSGASTKKVEEDIASLKSAINNTISSVSSIGNLQLYLPENNTDGFYLNAAGTPTADANSAYTDVIAVKAGETYMFTAERSAGSSATTLRVHGYKNGVWVQQIATISVVRPAGITKQSIAIPSDIDGVRISLYAKNRLSNIVFAKNVEGGMVTAYDNTARAKLSEADYIFTHLLIADNLFDVSTATDGVVLDSSIANPTYGQPVANADFVTSDYIRIFAGQTYTGNYTNHIAYYDGNKALISIQNQQYTTIAPDRAVYARFDINKTEFDPHRVVFAVSDALPSMPVDGVSVSLSDKIKIANIPNLFKATANLFNPATVRDGYYINHNTGVYVENSSFGASDFIPVNPNTTYTGNFTNHLVWFTLDRKRISGSNQTFTATSPETAAFAVIDFNKTTIPAEKIMFVEGGTLPADFVPHYVPVNRIPRDMIDYDVSAWHGKNILFYGDSITALINGDTAKRWSTYVSAALNPSGIHGRGVGGQTFAWNETGFEVDANGNYVKRGEGTDNCLGCFCSWQRISSMIIDSIKESIDLVVIMGGTNDLSGAEEVAGGEPIVWTTPNWSASNNADTQWAAATEYNGGDYDVSTLTGGILSTVMKIQTRCQNAKIVLASPLSRWSSSTHAPYARSSDCKTTRDVADAIKQAAEYMSVPFIDITTLCGINGWNYSQYIADGVHPNTSGDKMLAAAVISGLITVWPKIG